MNKAIKFIYWQLVAFAIMFPLTVFGQDIGMDQVENARASAGYQVATETSFAQTVGTVVKTAMSFLGIIFIVLMVYAGFLWMTARGEENQVTKAKDMIRASIVGLIIAVAAYGITTFVLDAILASTVE